MHSKKRAIERALLFLIVMLGISMVWNFTNLNFNYERFHTDGITYEKAIVTDVLKEELELYEADDQHMVGYQFLKIKFLKGEEKGKELEIENTISITHNVILNEGDRVIICADRPEEMEPYYSIYNYDRSTGVWGIAIAYFLLIILIGGKKGIRSCLGLVFTIIVVVSYLLPAIFHGKSAVFSAVFTVALSSAVTCFCIGGLEKKTTYNIISSMLGGFSAGIMYLILANILKLGGNSMAETESLTLISQATGMRLNGILFTETMVASLGAVMDVAVSLGASLHEIQMLNPNLGRKELFQSGLNIGKDMIGTMTLILAFMGGTMSTLLVFISYGIQYNQLISSDFLALEVMKGIAGNSAVVLTVPITAGVCALGYGKKDR